MAAGHMDRPVARLIECALVMRTVRWAICQNERTPEVTAPEFIGWRQAQVVRSNDGDCIDMRAKGHDLHTNILSFVPGDPELADRIEYAAKFLRMSCNEATDTGF